MSSFWHIRAKNSLRVEEDGLVWIRSLCGKTPVSAPEVNSWVFWHDAKAWWDHPDVTICQECLEHPEYAMWLLRGLDE